MCEEYNHWAELVFLYVQYDEYDNAALIMIAHSPTAWEHTHFKDVLVKVIAPFAPGEKECNRAAWCTTLLSKGNCRSAFRLRCAAQVSNVEVYYKAISFYLAAHPSLLVDMLKVLLHPFPMLPTSIWT